MPWRGRVGRLANDRAGSGGRREPNGRFLLCVSYREIDGHGSGHGLDVYMGEDVLQHDAVFTQGLDKALSFDQQLTAG